MGFDLAPTRTTYATEDRRWLRDIHGLTDTLGITLDGDLFPTNTFPDGTVPSGTRLGRVTTTKLAGPYDNAASDGRQTCIGHLLDTETVAAGRKVSVAVLDHGAVIRNKVPNPTALSGADITAAEVELPRIRYTNG